MDQLNFSDLEFNLYEILNLPNNCTTGDIKMKFRKLIKKFHPDKITKLEEKIYYYITLANHVLSNIEYRSAYDAWLLNNTNTRNVEENNIRESNDDIKKYFPSNPGEARREYEIRCQKLWERHGAYNEDSRSFSARFDEKMSQRNELRDIEKEDFRNMKDFNKTFDQRKNPDGKYGSDIITYKKNNQITQYEFNNKNLKYINMGDFNKMYHDDTIIGSYYTSLDLAYKLQANSHVQENPMDSAISNYNNQTTDLLGIHDNNFDI